MGNSLWSRGYWELSSKSLYKNKIYNNTSMFYKVSRTAKEKNIIQFYKFTCDMIMVFTNILLNGRFSLYMYIIYM